MGKNIQLSNINIKGDVNINGKLTVNNGSNFSGGRHYFQNMEKEDLAFLKEQLNPHNITYMLSSYLDYRKYYHNNK